MLGDVVPGIVVSRFRDSSRQPFPCAKVLEDVERRRRLSRASYSFSLVNQARRWQWKQQLKLLRSSDSGNDARISRVRFAPSPAQIVPAAAPDAPPSSVILPE